MNRAFPAAPAPGGNPLEPAVATAELQGRPDEAAIVAVIEELYRRVDEIEGSPLRLPNANVYLHTPSQVQDWLRSLLNTAQRGEWEWSDE